MKKKLIWVTLCLCFSAFTEDTSNWIKNESFSVRKSSNLEVFYKGNDFITKDKLDYSNGFAGATLKYDEKETAKALNVIYDTSALKYRKEIFVENGKMEISVKCELPSYKNNPQEKTLRYNLYVPVKFLKGFKYIAYVGKYGVKEIKGEVKENEIGSLTKTEWNRYIAFSDGKSDIVFDFNPGGIPAGSAFCSWGEPVGCWQITQEKDYIVFSFGCGATEDGRTMTSKLIIYDSKKDFDNLHAHRLFYYEGPITSLYRFAFGYDKAPVGYLNTAPVKDFYIDLQPGIYIATFNMDTRNASNSDIDLFINDVHCKKIGCNNKNTSEVTTVCVFKLNATRLKIKLNSESSLPPYTLSIQPLIYDSEDFKSLWNIKGLMEL